MLLIAQWFRAFVWTLGIELFVAGFCLRGSLPLGRRIGLICIANVATHPAVWLIFPELGAGLGWPSGASLAASEAWAFGFEAFVYGLFLGPGRWRLALGTSVAANAASLGAGFLLRALGWV
jgi:hypothetical protein